MKIFTVIRHIFFYVGHINSVYFQVHKMDFRRSLDFDSILDCNHLSTSSEEIMWSDDETIVAEQEQIWNEGKCRYKHQKRDIL